MDAVAAATVNGNSPLHPRRPAFGEGFDSSSLAMVTSPGNVVSSAPCAQPSFSASSGRGPSASRRPGRGKPVPAADAVDHIQLASSG